MFLQLIEIIMVVCGMLFILTQVLVPAFRDRPLFPMFRRANRKIKHSRDELGELAVIEDLHQISRAVEDKRKEVFKEN